MAAHIRVLTNLPRCMVHCILHRCGIHIELHLETIYSPDICSSQLIAQSRERGSHNWMKQQLSKIVDIIREQC